MSPPPPRWFLDGQTILYGPVIGHVRVLANRNVFDHFLQPVLLFIELGAAKGRAAQIARAEGDATNACARIVELVVARASMQRFHLGRLGELFALLIDLVLVLCARCDGPDLIFGSRLCLLCRTKHLLQYLDGCDLLAFGPHGEDCLRHRKAKLVVVNHSLVVYVKLVKHVVLPAIGRARGTVQVEARDRFLELVACDELVVVGIKHIKGLCNVDQPILFLVLQTLKRAPHDLLDRSLLLRGWCGAYRLYCCRCDGHAD